MENENKDNPYILPIAVVIAGVMIAGSLIYNAGDSVPQTKAIKDVVSLNNANGIVLPVTWGDLGSRIVSAGVIDAVKFKAIYGEREVLDNDGKLKITNENAGYLLNLFWALGLASKNPILESGEMTNPKYRGAGNFASTGGWTIAQSNAMNHYSRHIFFDWTPEQQALVDKISRGIYRPCCGNPTHIPDCNHGMAMLGLLELMASQGVNEADMYKAALVVNSYWFPDTYLNIAQYLKEKGIDWEDVNPKEILGTGYSSASGFAKIASQVTVPQGQGGGSGCGVDTGGTVAPQREQSGCGI